jgi:hypothetical protein
MFNSRPGNRCRESLRRIQCRWGPRVDDFNVAKVTSLLRTTFVAEARRVNPIVLGRADQNDDIFASEYARALLAKAEQVLLAGI